MKGKKLAKIMMMPVTLALCAVASISLVGCGGGIKGTPHAADRPITVVAREVGSGTRSAFMNILNNFTDIEDDNAKVTERYNDTAAVLNAVRMNGNAIGYDSWVM